MKHVSHYSSSEGMWYFVKPSRSDSPGGRDGEWEVIRAYHAMEERRWNMSNRMIALIKDERIAEQVAKLLAEHGLAIPDPLPDKTPKEKSA